MALEPRTALTIIRPVGHFRTLCGCRPSPTGAARSLARECLIQLDCDAQRSPTSTTTCCSNWVRYGEDLLVERTREPPAAPKFGAAVGSLAITLGGWVLLGVTD